LCKSIRYFWWHAEFPLKSVQAIYFQNGIRMPDAGALDFLRGLQQNDKEFRLSGKTEIGR
jgi:hypothetical protein